ncbi:OPT superfamily oligopeptide transporter [Linderina pennispora]|uniref:OPT superfamily oligopeptide transporter n=1 Tax=Linderina pennispora TaxID=61395 RepID=A0A1Y1W6L6_9FUNG|nr:OPT superfamily oligopeptide transporter [Linderina pennispora]ORX69161.1 OPT superfamily oligopeptide transporter [Linderina pennispora]
MYSEDSPYDLVRSTVAPTDSDVPSLTFRSVMLGLLFASVVGFVNQLMIFRSTPVQITGYVVQILSFPLGYLMSRILPTRNFSTFGYTWSFNPGRFSIKEHALITIFASSVASGSYIMDVVIMENLRYGVRLDYGPSILLNLSSQLLGYGFVGVVREILIYPAAMVFPASLVSVTLFRTFHESKSYLNHVSRVRFFWVAFTGMFVYAFLPGIVMPLLSAVPILCLAAPNNVIAHQLGDTYHGLGMANLTFDWSMISSGYFGPPVAVPWYIACNMFAGFVIMFWVLLPATYYSDLWDSGNLPVYSNRLFHSNGSKYDMSMVVRDDGKLDQQKYDAFGPLHLPIAEPLQYSRALIAISAFLVYTILHHGKDIYHSIFYENDDSELGDDDIHARLMRKYPEVPHWWYAAIFASMLAMSIAVCETYHLLPWYWTIIGSTISFIYVIPNGILLALTNQTLKLSIISYFIAGYGMPGNQLASVLFKAFTNVPMRQAIILVANFKMGHYLKIPPRHVFLSQVISTVLMSFVQCGIGIWMMQTVDGFCSTSLTWSCIPINSLYASSVIWGLVGPHRLFNSGSNYSYIPYMFIVGICVPFPVWYLQRRYPNSFWHNIHLPVALSSLAILPGAPSTVVVNWFFGCFIFQYVVHRYWYGYYRRYAFTLVAAFDSSVAIAAVLIFFIFTYSDVRMPSYWGTSTKLCPLSSSGGGFKNYQEFQSPP